MTGPRTSRAALGASFLLGVAVTIALGLGSQRLLASRDRDRPPELPVERVGGEGGVGRSPSDSDARDAGLGTGDGDELVRSEASDAGPPTRGDAATQAVSGGNGGRVFTVKSGDIVLGTATTQTIAVERLRDRTDRDRVLGTLRSSNEEDRLGAVRSLVRWMVHHKEDTTVADALGGQLASETSPRIVDEIADFLSASSRESDLQVFTDSMRSHANPEIRARLIYNARYLWGDMYPLHVTDFAPATQTEAEHTRMVLARREFVRQSLRDIAASDDGPRARQASALLDDLRFK